MDTWWSQFPLIVWEGCHLTISPHLPSHHTIFRANWITHCTNFNGMIPNLALKKMCVLSSPCKYIPMRKTPFETNMAFARYLKGKDCLPTIHFQVLCWLVSRKVWLLTKHTHNNTHTHNVSFINSGMIGMLESMKAIRTSYSKNLHSWGGFQPFDFHTHHKHSSWLQMLGKSSKHIPQMVMKNDNLLW